MMRTRDIAVEVDVERADGHRERVRLGATVHEPATDMPGGGATAARSGTAIVYLHGGGLLWGERDDLPACYIGQILERDHVLICLDYPLAPSVTAAGIADAVICALLNLHDEVLPRLGCTRYVLFGRSAGAYLALIAAARLSAQAARDHISPPAAVWDFYGYPALSPELAGAPCGRYAKLPAVDDATVRRIVASEGGTIPTSGPATTRFALYIHARQTGRWGTLLGVGADGAGAPALYANDLAALPPLFIAASTGDEDVPYGISKRLARAVPGSRLYTAYYLEHDFDRDTARPEGRAAYAQALDLLDDVSGDGASGCLTA